MSLLDTASLIVTPNGYKEGKLYSVIPSDGSGDMSVTRATTATRVNSAGLVELVPYNLVQYSEQFDNAAWTKSSVSVTANSTTAPNGTMTADTIVNTATSGILLQVSPSLSPSQLVTFSVYLKRSNNDWANVAIARNGATTYGELYVWFNIATGAVGSNLPDGAAVFVDADIENVGDGWYRCSVTGYVPNAVAYTAFVFNASADNSFTTSIGQSRYQWGAQLNEGTLKDYQKTETRLNIPRLDYSNGTCPSLLVEPQRTNLLTYSSSFDNAAWDKGQSSVIANSVTSPSGIQDADTLSVTSINENYLRGAGFSILGNVGSAYTTTIYVKKGTANFLRIRNLFVQDGGDFGNAWFNITNGTVATVQSSQTATIEDAGNGWYRCSLTGVVGSSNRFNFVDFGLTDTDNTLYPSTAVNSYIWGAQLEAGSYATSYIPTTSASVTRNADVISKTGIGSLIGQTEGTLFVELDIINGAESLGIWTRTGVTPYNDMITILVSQFGTCIAEVRASNVTQFANSSFSIGSGKHKFALAYKANDFAFYIDGTQIATSSSGTPPTCDQVYLGGYPDGGARLSKNIATALWKTRLTNTQLATLTTL